MSSTNHLQGKSVGINAKTKKVTYVTFSDGEKTKKHREGALDRNIREGLPDLLSSKTAKNAGSKDRRRKKQTMNPLFQVHKLNDAGFAKATKMAVSFENFYSELHKTIFNNTNGTAPDWQGREWSIVKTKLEEACFYAKKTLANQAENTNK